MKRPEITIPTVLGLLMAVSGLVTGIWLVANQVRERGVASAEETPQEVKITNISDSSFTVSWVTERATSGYVKYGEEQEEPELIVSDERDQQKGSVENYFTHYVVIQGLKPETGYEFEIGSGRNLYNLGEELYRAETAPAITETPDADVAYGKIITKNGDPAEGAIVYYQIPGAVLLSAIVKQSGSFVIPVSTARVTDLTEYASYDREKTTVQLTIQGGPMGMTTAETSTDNDSPVGDMALGGTYAFTQQDIVSNPLPTATPEPEIIGPPTSLSVLAPKSGEKLNSTRPQIIGKAPAGTEITIEIHSEALVSGIAVADDTGNYAYSVPMDIPAGEHTLTVSAVIDGLVQTVTKTFMVFAAGESFLPAFSASPSATMAPSPSATGGASPTVTPRVSPSPTAKPTTTIIPTTSPTLMPPTPTPATNSGLPKTGEVNTTWLILIAATGMIIAGSWSYTKARWGR